jgi:N,N'-diacetyllegionaminate synthase
MIRLIAETAWHHQGDFQFMKNLVSKIVSETNADIVKMHITINFDEYMDSSHPSYEELKSMIFSRDQWKELIRIIRKGNKEIMLLLNDTQAIEFGLSFNPEYVEIHSVCLNDIFMLKKLKNSVKKKTKIVLGVGGTSLDEIKNVINFLKHPNIILMFGFQNYPTIYENVNLNKIKRLMNLFNNLEYGYADHTAWDSDHNELITLLGAAVGMRYLEKHVTTHYGKKRLDWSSAISFKMLNSLKDKVNILEKLNGNGSLYMTSGERSYSVFGPMKKAAMLISDIPKGSILRLKDIKFIRAKEISDMSQLDVINSIGKKISNNLKKGSILMSKYFIRIK